MLTEDLITYEQVEHLIAGKSGQWFHVLPDGETGIGLTRNGEWPLYCPRCAALVLLEHGLDPVKYQLVSVSALPGYRVVRKEQRHATAP